MDPFCSFVRSQPKGEVEMPLRIHFKSLFQLEFPIEIYVSKWLANHIDGIERIYSFEIKYGQQLVERIIHSSSGVCTLLTEYSIYTVCLDLFKCTIVWSISMTISLPAWWLSG